MGMKSRKGLPTLTQQVVMVQGDGKADGKDEVVFAYDPVGVRDSKDSLDIARFRIITRQKNNVSK